MTKKKINWLDEEDFEEEPSIKELFEGAQPVDGEFSYSAPDRFSGDEE
jgi:hypothetical protein